MTHWHGVRSEFRCEPVDTAWQVQRVSMTERLNEPYRAQVTLRTSAAGADPDELLGQRCTITLEREAFVRQVHGIVAEVHALGFDDAHRAVCEVAVVPALALAEFVTDSRIFQHATVPAILEELLTPLLATDQRELRQALQRRYAEREYVTQYQETSLAFAHRLMEEEGIGYCFEQTDEAEVLVMLDANRSYPELEAVDGSTLRFVTRAESAADDDEYVSHIAHRTCLGPTSVAMTDWDWTSPTNPPTAEERGEDPLGRDLEHHVHRRRPATIGSYDASARRYQERDHTDRARLLREVLTHDGRILSGSGTVCGLTAGARASLVGHISRDGDYLVCTVEHELVVEDGAATRSGRYRNRFEALPLDVPYRPVHRTPRPNAGTVTATVVGAAEEGYLHVDEHGRIKVQFHWDRRGERDERSSCWVRVAQDWAGRGRGSHFLPRIGDEVVVGFLDRDPDQPLVIRSVYNADNTSHTPTPDRQRVSGLMSQTFGSDGYNALLLDDEPGEEAIDVHAQRDYRERVLNDQQRRIDRHQSNSVGGNQEELVEGNQTLTVQQERRKTVEQNETIEVQKNRTTTVVGDDDTTVRADQSLTVKGKREVTVKGTQRTTITGATTYKHEATRELTVQQNNTERVHGNHELTVDGTLTIRVGEGCTLTMTPTGRVTLEVAQAFITTVGDAAELRIQPETIEALAQLITVAAEQTATVSGAEKNSVTLGDGAALVHGQSEVQLQAKSGGNVTANAEGVTHTGTTVSSQGSVTVEAAGPLIKLN